MIVREFVLGHESKPTKFEVGCSGRYLWSRTLLNKHKFDLVNEFFEKRNAIDERTTKLFGTQTPPKVELKKFSERWRACQIEEMLFEGGSKVPALL